MQFYIGNCGQILPRVKVKLASQLEYEPTKFVNIFLGFLSYIVLFHYKFLLVLQTGYRVPYSFDNFK